jgi:hypothetical protein
MAAAVWRKRRDVICEVRGTRLLYVIPSCKTYPYQNINQIKFYFAEEGPGRGPEDIKTECNVNCFDFFLLFCLFDGRHEWKNDSQLNRTALN